MSPRKQNATWQAPPRPANNGAGGRQLAYGGRPDAPFQEHRLGSQDCDGCDGTGKRKAAPDT